MADLTINLKISGKLNGVPIDIDDTYTLASVLDVAQKETQVSSIQTGVILVNSGSAGLLTAPEMEYASPYVTILANNDSEGGIVAFDLTNAAGPTTTQVILKAGEVFILYKAAAGGCFNSSATATTATYLDLDSIALSAGGEDYPAKANAQMMAIYK